jgi:hypothetical protein
MKHLFLSLFLLLAASSYAQTNGTTGDVSWTLDAQGTLTISGTGAMAEYFSERTPWYPLRESVTAVVVEMGVTSIGYGAFENCSRLTSVSISESVTVIGGYVFGRCVSLATITIPASVDSIGTNPFAEGKLTGVVVASNNPSYCSEGGVLFDKNKERLIWYPQGKAGSSYTIPESVTVIGEYAFENCIGLTSVILPKSLTSIEQTAFNACLNLASIALPESLTSIGTYAFSQCNMASIAIPDGVKVIDIGTFSFCTSLESITLPSSLESIQYSAFYWCPKLKSINIPKSVKFLGEGIVNYSTGLTDITVNWATPLNIRSNVFAYAGFTLSDVTLHVPADTKALYEAHNEWKKFNIEEQPPVGIEDIQPSKGLGARTENGWLHVGGLSAGESWFVYNASGTLVHQRVASSGEASVFLAARGVYFVRSGNRSVKVVY